MDEISLLNLLDTLQISFQRIGHPAISSIEEYYRLGIDLPDQGVKNLFLRNRKGNRYYLLVLDERKVADLATLADQINETRLSFGSAERLMEYLGGEPGSVTPFGLLHDTDHKVEVLLDDTIKQDELVGFHPLVNHATVCISYRDFMRFLDYCGHPPRLISLE